MSYSTNLCSDKSLTLPEVDANLDKTPWDNQESALSSCYLLASSTPFLAGRIKNQSNICDSTNGSMTDLFKSNTSRVEFSGSDISDWMKGNHQGEGMVDFVFGSCINGNLVEEEFEVMNQNFEHMLCEDEELVAESNDSITKYLNQTDWSACTANIHINSDLVPSVNSSNSGGNISRYFQCKSRAMGQSISKRGIRPKFSNDTCNITSPQKVEPIKLVKESVTTSPDL